MGTPDACFDNNYNQVVVLTFGSGPSIGPAGPACSRSWIKLSNETCSFVSASFISDAARVMHSTPSSRRIIVEDRHRRRHHHCLRLYPPSCYCIIIFIIARQVGMIIPHNDIILIILF